MSGSGYGRSRLERWRAVVTGLGVVAAMVATVAAPAARTPQHGDSYRIGSFGSGGPTCPDWGCGANHNQARV